jgi:hypothetical protein
MLAHKVESKGAILFASADTQVSWRGPFQGNRLDEAAIKAAIR